MGAELFAAENGSQLAEKPRRDDQVVPPIRERAQEMIAVNQHICGFCVLHFSRKLAQCEKCRNNAAGVGRHFPTEPVAVYFQMQPLRQCRSHVEPTIAQGIEVPVPATVALAKPLQPGINQGFTAHHQTRPEG